MSRITLITGILLVFACFVACTAGSLNTPTQFHKLSQNIYIIVDCWNDRLLYTTKFSPTDRVQVFLMVPTVTPLQYPHSIATNGNIMLVDSSKTNQVVALKFYSNTVGPDVVFEETQVLSNIGVSPHFTTYSDSLEKFVVLGAHSLTLHFIEWNDESGLIRESSMIQLPLELEYIRSFVLYEDKILIGPTSSNPFFFEWTLDISSDQPRLRNLQKIPFAVDRFGYSNFVQFSFNGMLIFERKLWLTVYVDGGDTGPYIESYDIVACHSASSTSTHIIQKVVTENNGNCQTTFVNRSIQYLSPDVSPPYLFQKTDSRAPFTPYYLTRFDGRIFMGLIHFRSGIYSWPESESPLTGTCHFCDN